MWSDAFWRSIFNPPTDWHVLILCIIFHLENLYFRVKWYVEYGNVLLNLISQWNLSQYITFYRNHNFVEKNPPVARLEILEISLYQID